jgi:zinc protease
MRRDVACLITAVSLLFVNAPASATPAEPAPVAELAKAIDIPFVQFTLKNGLRVVVHTDRKAPVIATSIWYHVGSKDEPKGKTGFAHLFEHLMFNGSENAPDDFFESLQQIGATDLNGTTSTDRTNYFQTVPTGAFERILFLESDRMGRLLGGIDQAKLDNQRGVVQNEKRQNDNQPFSLSDYIISDAIFPVGHPYHHQIIGSMDDLNNASLADVKSWFRAKYGPDNAVLVLAGDIDVATAKPLVEKWFGGFARGPKIVRRKAAVPVLKVPIIKVITDRVPYTRIQLVWPVEGSKGKDATALEVAGAVLGGLSSSRLDNALVRDEKSAVNVSAWLDDQEDVGTFNVVTDVKPGLDAALVAKRLNALIAEFIAGGPSADEVQRAATREIAEAIDGLESVGGFGGKAVTLASGMVFAGDAAHYKKELVDLAAVTPATVRMALQKWLTRPSLSLMTVPGAREDSAALRMLTGDAITTTPAPVVTEGATAKPAAAAKIAFPAIGELTALDFPAIERATLSNGIPVYFARSRAVPTVRVSMSFDAGQASDPADGRGTQSMMLGLLREGTTTRDSARIAEDSERLGTSISSGAGLDRSNIGMFALTPNLGPSLDLFADIVRNPAFDPQVVERVRAQRLAGIAARLSSAEGIAGVVMPSLLYGKAHPYATAGAGDAAVVAELSRDAILQFHRQWIRPGIAQIFVVGDTDLSSIKAMLEACFGNWADPAGAHPTKDFSAAIPVAKPRIVLIDRPGSPQSVIVGGLVLERTGKDDLLTLRTADDVLGGNFLSRINMDLRETKGWSYGTSTQISSGENRVSYSINAPVQTDRTGDSLRAIMAHNKDYFGPKGTTAFELERSVNGSIRSLPGDFETSDSVMAAMQRIVWLGRPDDYFERLPQKYRAMTVQGVDAAVRAEIDPSKLLYLVVGDAAKVRPQLDGLGLAVETLSLPNAPSIGAK